MTSSSSQSQAPSGEPSHGRRIAGESQSTLAAHELGDLSFPRFFFPSTIAPSIVAPSPSTRSSGVYFDSQRSSVIESQRNSMDPSQRGSMGSSQRGSMDPSRLMPPSFPVASSTLAPPPNAFTLHPFAGHPLAFTPNPSGPRASAPVLSPLPWDTSFRPDTTDLSYSGSGSRLSSNATTSSNDAMFEGCGSGDPDTDIRDIQSSLRDLTASPTSSALDEADDANLFLSFFDPPAPMPPSLHPSGLLAPMPLIPGQADPGPFPAGHPFPGHHGSMPVSHPGALQSQQPQQLHPFLPHAQSAASMAFPFDDAFDNALDDPPLSTSLRRPQRAGTATTSSALRASAVDAHDEIDPDVDAPLSLSGGGSSDTGDADDKAPRHRRRSEPPLRPVMRAASGGTYRKRVSEMSEEELRRVRECNRLMARKNRAKKRASTDALRDRLGQLRATNAQLQRMVASYRGRVGQLLSLVRSQLEAPNFSGTALRSTLVPSAAQHAASGEGAGLCVGVESPKVGSGACDEGADVAGERMECEGNDGTS
jgi:hypothetical protein